MFIFNLFLAFIFKILARVIPLVLDPAWPENIQAFLMTLREIGLIFIRKRKDGYGFAI
jgi:hypothetical protein